MASERDLELLDDYIGNRLSAKQKAEFEQRLANDPELTKQYNFQHEIAASLRKARVAELKTMLNNVSVASVQVGQTSLVTKIAGVAVIAGVIATGLYYYFYVDNDAPAPHKKEVAITESQPESKPEVAPPSSVEEKDQKQPLQDKEPKAEETMENTDTKIGADTQEPGEQGKEPSLDVFDPTAELESNEIEKSNTIDNGSAEASSNSTITVVTDSNNKKYNFHYQFKEGKLFLYGTFEKNLYEILEFFTDNKRTIFLFYKNNYYLLNEENEKIKGLAPITDAALLKKLKEYRAN